VTITAGDRQLAIALGQRLRFARAEQSLSLMQLEEKSDGRFKAVVVGSYERGDRMVTVVRLAELAAFYGVPVADLLPPEWSRDSRPSPLVLARRLVARLEEAGDA
jgi:transcriptional regulator with XRE-family HTH domain